MGTTHSKILDLYMDAMVVGSPQTLMLAKLRQDFEEEVEFFRRELAKDNVYMKDIDLWYCAIAALLQLLAENKDALNNSIEEKASVKPEPDTGYLYAILRSYIKGFDTLEAMYRRSIEGREDTEIALGVFFLAYLRKLHEMIATQNREDNDGK